MPNRNYTVGTGYRYGFNGKELDKESSVQYDYGFRIYDPRLSRFKSVDPLTNNYPELTPYQFSGNNPITFIDLDGLEMAWRNPVTGEIKAAGPLALPVGSRNADGWILFQPAVRKTATSTTTSSPQMMKPALQQGSDYFASVKAAQNKQIALRQIAATPKPRIPQNVTTVGPDNRTEYQKQLSDEYARQAAQAKVIGQMMETPEGQGGMALGLTMYNVARTPVTAYEHASGAVQDFNEGNYWGAAGNTLLFTLDVAPLLIKGSGAVSTEIDAAHNAASFERLKASFAQQEILNSPAVGSALKSDTYHMAGSFVVDDIASKGRFFTIKGGDGVLRNLTQMEGTVNGQKGIFE